VAAGGDATNVSNNDASQGGAVSGTGDATGSFTDDNSDDDLIDDKDLVDIDDQDLVDDKDFADDKDLIDDKDVVDVDLGHGPRELHEDPEPVKLLADELPEEPPAADEPAEELVEG
jgi:hypothetical protein